MEPTVLSGPLGHSRWESEQPFPLGFHTLDSDNGGVLCTNKTGPAGFQDYRNCDQDETSQANEDLVYKEEPVDLDSFINIPDFSCGDLQFEDQSDITQLALCSNHIREFTEHEGLVEVSDCSLTWSFSPKLGDVVGKNSAIQELSLIQADPFECSSALGSQAELISLCVPVSPSEISETSAVDPSLLVDLSNETLYLPSETSGDMYPQGVSEELVNLSQEEQDSLLPSQNTETLSHETRDRGLFPAQVTDLVTCSPTLQCLPDTSLPHNHINTPLEYVEGSVPLLDLEIPDCDGSLSLCPACPCAPFVSLQDSDVKHTGVFSNLTSELGENDSCVQGLSVEAPSLTLPLAEDAVTPGDFTSESYSVENDCKDLMEDTVCSNAKPQENEVMALDLCLTADDETLDLAPQNGVQHGSISDLTTEQREEERLSDTNLQDAPECHEVASFDFSVQEIHISAPEAGWTSEQTASLSKVVADDSLPMVSAVSTREEDVSPLKAVFDALDQDGDGFVRIEEFMEFAAAYGADQVRCFTLQYT